MIKIFTTEIVRCLKDQDKRLRSTLIVPNNFDKEEFQKIFLQEVNEKYGILPLIVTLSEWLTSIRGIKKRKKIEMFFPLVLKIKNLFKENSLQQSIYMAQFLLETYSFCFQEGGSLQHPPFPLIFYDKRGKILWELLKDFEENKNFSDEKEIYEFLLRNSDEYFFLCDFFPSTSLPLMDQLRLIFQQIPYCKILSYSTVFLKKEVFYADFSTLDQEALFVAQKVDESQKNHSEKKIAIISDHRSLMKKIQAELTRLSFPIQMRKTDLFLKDTIYGAMIYDIALWLEEPLVNRLFHVLSHFVCLKTVKEGFLNLFYTFVQKIYKAPSQIIEGNLIIPEQAHKEDGHLLILKKYGKNSDLLHWFDAFSRIIQSCPFEGEHDFNEFLFFHRLAWEMLGKECCKNTLSCDFFDVLSRENFKIKMKVHDYIQIIRAFLGFYQEKFSSFASFNVDIKNPILLLSTREALFYDYDIVFLPGMNEGEWFSEEKYPVFFQKPSSIDLKMEEDTLKGIMDKKIVYATRTLRHNERPHRFLSSICKKEIEKLQNLKIFAKKEEKLKSVKAYVPQENRPFSFSISDLQGFQDDAYAFYAKKILKLFPYQASSWALDYGKWAHDLLNHYVKDGFFEKKISLCDFAQKQRIKNPLILKKFFPRLLPVLKSLNDDLEKNRSHLCQILTEYKITMMLTMEGKNYEIYGIADRIDIYEKMIHIIDYKTGELPAESSLQKGDVLQLPLEAHMLQKQYSKAEINLVLIQLKQELGKKNELIIPFSEVLKQKIEEKLKKLLEFYNHKDFIFESFSSSKKLSKHYEHLERLFSEE